MMTYWDSFMVEFKEKIPYRSIYQILEAFWYYCNNDKEKAIDIMGRDVQQQPPPDDIRNSD